MKAATRRGDCQGSALIFAIGLLFVFSLFGAAYVRFGYLELDRSNADLGLLRAEQAAAGGVQAALGHLRAAEEAGQVKMFLGIENLYSFPVYKKTLGAEAGENTGFPEGAGMSAVDNRSAQAKVVVTDESAKVNLNHAPASVLQAILGVDGPTARAITAGLPRAEAPGPGGWLLDLNDLVTRGLLTPEQLAHINPALVTTMSVADHAAPHSYLNVNGAPPQVLAAVLNIPQVEAEALAQRGPFDSLTALAEAAGKGADTFNLPAGPDGNTALAFGPASFRITSSGTYAQLTAAGGEQSVVTSQVEAVVHRIEAGAYEIVYWRTARGKQADTVEPVEAGETAEPAVPAVEEPAAADPAAPTAAAAAEAEVSTPPMEAPAAVESVPQDAPPAPGDELI